MSGFRTYEGTDVQEDNIRIKKEIKDELLTSSDPFIGYGYGILAYFNLIRNLIYVYVAICLLGIVMMILNRSHTVGLVEELPNMIAQYSVAALGYAQ